MSRERKKDTLYSWVYLGVIVFAVCLIIGMLYSVGVIIVVVFVDYYEESNAKAGWISSISFFLNCGTYPVLVYLRRYFGFRCIILCTSLLVVFTFISTTFMPTLNFVFLTYSISFGIGSGLFDCFSVITLREYFDKYLGLATGIRFASVGVGVMMYNLFLPILFDAFGWKKTFFALSAFLGMACFACSMVYRRLPADIEKEPPNINDQEVTIESFRKTETSYTRTSYGFLRNKRFLILLIGSVPFAFVYLSPSIFLIQHAKYLGYPLSKSKWILIVYGITSVLGRLTIACIGDLALRKKKVAHISAIALVFFGVGNGLCSLTQSLPLMTSCAGLIGFFDGIYWANLPLMSFEVTAGEQTDEVFSLMIFVTAFAQLVGLPVSGWIFDISRNFLYILYLVFTCSITGGFIMGIGIYFTSPKNGIPANIQDKETAVEFNKNGWDYFSLLDIRTFLQRNQLIPLLQYESAV